MGRVQASGQAGVVRLVRRWQAASRTAGGQGAPASQGAVAPGPGPATALVAHNQSKGQGGVGGNTPGPGGWDEAVWQAWWDDWQYNHAKGEWQEWDSRAAQSEGARSAWAGQTSRGSGESWKWSSRDWGWRHER